jgi:flagellar biosynthesis protein FlhA
MPLPMPELAETDGIHYSIEVRRVAVARGRIEPNHILAVGTLQSLSDLASAAEVHPAFGSPAVWIDERQRSRAERLGCRVLEPLEVVTTHFDEVVRASLWRLLSVQQINEWLAESDPTLRALVDARYSLLELHELFAALLEERVSVLDREQILTTLVRQPAATLFPDTLAAVRRALTYWICRELVDPRNCIRCFELEEAALARFDAERPYSSRAPELQPFFSSVRAILAANAGPAVFCVPNRLRWLLRQLTRSRLQVLWLTPDEIPPGVELEVVGKVGWSELTSPEFLRRP